MVRRKRDVASAEQPLCPRHPPSNVSGSGIPSSLVRTILAVTGTAVAVWTVGIFLFAKALGSNVLSWLQRWNSGGFAVLLLVVAVWSSRFAFQSSSVRGTFAAVFWLHSAAARAGSFGPRGCSTSCRSQLPLARDPLSQHHTAKRRRTQNLSVLRRRIKIATLKDLHATNPEFTSEAHLLAGATPAERSASLEQLCARHGIECPFILKPDSASAASA